MTRDQDHRCRDQDQDSMTRDQDQDCVQYIKTEIKTYNCHLELSRGQDIISKFPRLLTPLDAMPCIVLVFLFV